MRNIKKMEDQKYCAICKNDFLIEESTTCFIKWKIHRKCIWKLVLIILGVLIIIIGIILSIVFWFLSLKH